MSIRVAIVDDHPLVVDGLVSALKATPDIEIVAAAGTPDSAGSLLRRSDLDVVLLDVRLDGANGLQLLAERGERVRPYVLVLSSFSTSQYVAAAARYGASGFLLKTAPIEELLSSIATVAAGGTVFTATQLRSPFVMLSPRERTVVAFVVEGLTNKEIAERLGTSKKGVEFHLTAIFNRYGIKDGRVELALRATSEGWLEIDPPLQERHHHHT